jgi:hypothetical protein
LRHGKARQAGFWQGRLPHSELPLEVTESPVSPAGNRRKTGSRRGPEASSTRNPAAGTDVRATVRVATHYPRYRHHDH